MSNPTPVPPPTGDPPVPTPGPEDSPPSSPDTSGSRGAPPTLPNPPVAPLDTQTLVNQQVAQVLANLLATQSRQTTPGNYDGGQTRELEAKVKDPEEFNGTRSKFRTFIRGCQSVFEGQPRRYSTDRAKIYYMGSRLTGPPQAWWSSLLEKEDDDRPDYFKEYKEFVRELERRYGDPDWKSRLERELLAFRMRGSAAGYVSEFCRMVDELRWDVESAPVGALFYHNLSPTIKDELFVEVSALLDSGADINFIDRDFLILQGITPTKLRHPLPVTLADGLRSTTSVTHFIKLTLRFDRFEETITFGVFPLRSQPIILGMPWFHKFEPEVSWRQGKVLSYPFAPTLENPISGTPDIKFISAAAFKDEAKKGAIGVFLGALSVRSDAATVGSDDRPLTGLDHVPREFHDFADVFSDDPKHALPPHRPFDHRIPLEPGTTPPFGPIYKLSPVEMATLHDYIQDSLASGIIRPSESPAGAPILFVKKKDGSLRLCLLDRLGAAKIFSKIDLRNAYHQIRIAKGDEWKTAFRTRYGLFEYLVMPFGLTNAPASFQNLVNRIFADMLDQHVIAYLDDILIYSANEADHKKHIRAVLGRLRSNNLFARPEKCDFFATSIDFLGYIVSADGISMDPAKVKAIEGWPVPTVLRHVQAFLGFCNFYRQFIKAYSIIAAALTDLTKGDGSFKWTPEANKAFLDLKAAFRSADILQHADPRLQFILETDASDYGMGAVLSQRFPDGIRPVAFFSKKFSPAELNYTVHNKELLAIVSSLMFWRSYLEGAQHPVLILSDHQPLVYFTTKRLLDPQQARWSVDLQRFDYVIQHRPGCLSGKPDALSRRADHELTAADREHDVRSILRLTAATTTDLHIDSTALEAIRLAQQTDSDCRALAERVRTDTRRPGEQRFVLHADGLVRHQDQLYVPDAGRLRLSIVEDHHNRPLAGHPGRRRTFASVRRHFFWDGIKAFVDDFVASCLICQRSKSRRAKPTGLLRPLDVPSRPWRTVTMDFIVHLPTSNGFDAICVMVCPLTKGAKFEPCLTSTKAPDLAELFLRRVVAQHGVPEMVVTDRGTQFTSDFWRSLSARAGTDLRFSTAHHPRTDGQTEIVNQWLDQYLRMYTCYQQDDWADFLPLAEFAYNSASHASTGISPFFALYGFHPRGPDDAVGRADLRKDDPRLADANAHARADRVAQIHAYLRSRLTLAKELQKKYFDRNRSEPPPYKKDDFVLVDTENINLRRPSVKLAPRYIGPFQIIKQISPVNFQLDLPPSIKIHPVLHVDVLKPAPTSTIPGRVQTPPPPDIVDDTEEWEVQEILDTRRDARRTRDPVKYLVRWTGYSDDTWEPYKHLANAMDKVHAFH
ncbi:unnamed protein product [Cutaneotrichosporon oleaginosum]